ncbi:MAG: VOC family protein [Myxococcales bacterium]|nr:VOC family protein [Myxococcales bacterium]
MRLHHLALRTAAPEPLAAFYADVFGLSRVREQAGYSIWLGLDDAVLMIERAAPDEPLVPAGSLEFCAFAVDEAGRAAVEARLADHGCAVEARTAYTLYFRDPDGRRVGVSTYPLPAGR